jgi:hypothetical protein
MDPAMTPPGCRAINQASVRRNWLVVSFHRCRFTSGIPSGRPCCWQKALTQSVKALGQKQVPGCGDPCRVVGQVTVRPPAPAVAGRDNTDAGHLRQPPGLFLLIRRKLTGIGGGERDQPFPGLDPVTDLRGMTPGGLHELAVFPVGVPRQASLLRVLAQMVTALADELTHLRLEQMLVRVPQQQEDLRHLVRHAQRALGDQPVPPQALQMRPLQRGQIGRRPRQSRHEPQHAHDRLPGDAGTGQGTPPARWPDSRGERDRELLVHPRQRTPGKRIDEAAAVFPSKGHLQAAVSSTHWPGGRLRLIDPLRPCRRPAPARLGQAPPNSRRHAAPPWPSTSPPAGADPAGHPGRHAHQATDPGPR